MANYNAKPPKHSQFKPGQSGNPGGRPAVRDALANKYTEDVYAVWLEFGIEGLRRLAKEDPAKLAAIACEQIAKDAQKGTLEHKHSGSITHHEHRVSEAARSRIRDILGDGQPGDSAPLLSH